MKESAALAAKMLDETFLPIKLESYPDDIPLAGIENKPLIGIMDSSSTSDDGRMEIFGNVTHYPALKFVMISSLPVNVQTKIFSEENEEDEDSEGSEDSEFPEDSAAYGKVIYPDIYIEEMAGVTDEIIPNVPNEEKLLVWGDDDFDGHVQAWDFIGPKDTATDLYDSVMMYWYRAFVSHTRSFYVEPTKDDPNNVGKATPPYFTLSSHHHLKILLHRHGNFILRPAKARRRHPSKLESEVFNFYMGMDESVGDVGGAYRPLEYFDDDTSLILNKDNDMGEGERNAFTQEIDPYVLVVQCRARINYEEIIHEEMTAEEISLLKNQHRAMDDFDALAEIMVHRMDVAFFALDATNYLEDETDNTRMVCGGLFGDRKAHLNGAVAFVRIRRFVDYYIKDGPANNYIDKQNRQRWQVTHNVRTDWDEIKSLVPHEIFVPAITDDMQEGEKEIYGKTTVKDPMLAINYVHTNLVASTAVHVTPTVIWFDKERMSQLAFSWYRKIHAVLFVDMGLAHKISRPNSINITSWPSSLDYSKESRTLLRNQRSAIRLFYQCALRHRRQRPRDDIVFLIVPSSEVRIMTAFGIDIWTPLDEALFGTLYEDNSNGAGEEFDLRNSIGNEYCSTPVNVDSQSILPMMMITDSLGRSGMQSSRYYLCSDDIVSPRTTNKDGGAIADFVDKFFNGTIGKPFVRSQTPLSASVPTPQGMRNANKPNVTVLTGNTFESLVMDRRDVHTMLLMQTTTCGHCKRFSIFWNELSSLVQAMNWSSVISVTKIDVAKNDVPHSKINAWDVPSVYYLPANQKNEPIELPTPTLPHSNPQHSYDEGLSWVTSGYDLVKWMIDQGKLDLDLLSRLDGSSVDSMSAD